MYMLVIWKYGTRLLWVKKKKVNLTYIVKQIEVRLGFKLPVTETDESRDWHNGSLPRLIYSLQVILANLIV